MKKPSRQEIIDTIYHQIINGESRPAANLREAKSKGARKIYYTMYRGTGGGCAIGRVLPESLYHGGLEGKSIGLLWREREEIHNYFEEAGVDFLQEIQTAYDNAAVDTELLVRKQEDFLAKFSADLLEIIEKWGLEFPGDIPSTNRLTEIVADENRRRISGGSFEVEHRGHSAAIERAA